MLVFSRYPLKGELLSMAKGRPGGNPEITKHSFNRQHKWSQSCTVVKAMKMPPLMAEALKNGELPDWQEVCRQAIAAQLSPDTAQKLGWHDSDDNE